MHVATTDQCFGDARRFTDSIIDGAGLLVTGEAVVNVIDHGRFQRRSLVPPLLKAIQRIIFVFAQMLGFLTTVTNTKRFVTKGGCRRHLFASQQTGERRGPLVTGIFLKNCLSMASKGSTSRCKSPVRFNADFVFVFHAYRWR